MELEEHLRSLRLPDPPSILETRIRALVRETCRKAVAPAWMRSPFWVVGFALAIGMLTFVQEDPERTEGAKNDRWWNEMSLLMKGAKEEWSGFRVLEKAETQGLAERI